MTSPLAAPYNGLPVTVSMVKCLALTATLTSAAGRTYFHPPTAPHELKCFWIIANVFAELVTGKAYPAKCLFKWVIHYVSVDKEASLHDNVKELQ